MILLKIIVCYTTVDNHINLNKKKKITYFRKKK